MKNETPNEEIKVTPSCKMTVCEDPETGEIIMTYEKGCPKGYIEKIAGRIATYGLRLKEER